ncbi:MAG: efflux RND transporter periplasmic adaptor subunit [Rhizobiaceae bacterium]|nr:efflux RND transporter periplasmic adaptor subunit [Rhizobiaceae bacterium]
MSLWKQAIVSLVLLTAAAGLWARYFPGASDMLTRWGLDWIPVATATTQPEYADNPLQRRGGGPQQLVVAEPVTEATINDRLTAIGTGRAANSVVVTPFSSGRLREVLVGSGTSVEAGEVIARLDSESEQIAVDRAHISLDDARARLERINALRSSNTASAVQVTEAELAVRNAELALRDAELALARRSIAAPISGTVGIVPVSAGNYVTAQSEIATIDDRSEILVDFWVPERYAGLVELGAPIEATSIARPNEVFGGEVSALDNRIDEQSRTLHIQARIENPADTLRAGMSFRVTMRFPGDRYPAVNPLSIQWGSDGAFVWSIDNGVGRRVPVRVIQRNTDTVLIDAEIAPGTMVVTEGIHSIREGQPVATVGQRPPETSQAEPGDGRRRGS